MNFRAPRAARWLACLALASTVPLGTRAAVTVLAEHPGSRVKQVIVVFKTHFDIGYTDLASNVVARYRTSMIDNALGVMDASRDQPPERQFSWTVPGWPLRQILGGGQTPERRERVLGALRDRRLAVHAMPFTTETEANDLEDLVRGLRFSVEIATAAGLERPRAGKMTDVPEHSWVLPTLLTHAGINFFHIGCNGGSAWLRVPPLFLWEGPDGSRLLTFYAREYGTGLVPPEDWPYRTWLAMTMTGDNHGPPTPQEVAKVLERAARELPGVAVKFGRLEDFAAAIEAEHPALPVVRGDAPDTWIHGLMSMPVESQLARDLHPLEDALGSLDTHLRAAGLAPPPVGPLLADAYEHSLLYGEHTWGLSGTAPGKFRYGDEWREALAAGKYTRFLRSFEDHRDYIRTAAGLVTNALDARLQALAGAVKAAGRRIVVYNPLPWPRSGPVAVGAAGELGPLTDLAAKRSVPIEWDGATRRIRFDAADVPACGYKTFALPAVSKWEPGPGASFPAGGILEGAFFKIAFDLKRGGLASLVDRQSGRELLEAKPEYALGQYLHEQFALTNVQSFMRAYCRGQEGWMGNDFGKPGMPGPDRVPYRALTPTNWTLGVERTAVADTAWLRCADAAPMAKAATLRVTLPRDRPYVELEWGIEGKTPDPLPEGGWLCLPFAIKDPSFRVGRLGSIVDPARDLIPGANRNLLCLASGLTLAGPDGFGVGLCAIDAPLVSLDEPGLWKFSLDFVPKRARVFVNLYNNQWNTNFPLWQEGTWSSRVRLWVVRGAGAEAELVAPAWEARTPLLAAAADGPAGALPVSARGLALSRGGVLVTCFGPGPYGEPLLLRLWEQAGKGGACEVRLPAGLQAVRAQLVDLRGEKCGAPIAIRDGVFTTDLGAFAPASFAIE